jgi:hypothetical protein
MKLLKSTKLEIPKLFLITDKKEIRDLPIGVPFILGDASIEGYIVRLLEYEVLFQAAKKTGYPFNFKKILKDNGFDDIEDFYWSNPVYMDFATDEMIGEDCDEESLELEKIDSNIFSKFVEDSTCIVDIEKLKSLNVFPVWLDNIEEAISTNINNFAIFNPNMYNKKLEGMYGSIELRPPSKNLIIIDISGSIPKAVSTTCLTLSKNLAETFYADLLITGSKSTLYDYSELYKLDVQKVYDENGTDNDQVVFKKLLSGDKKVYKTCIVFGDNHHPGNTWTNQYNKRTKYISDEGGKKLCKWDVEDIISFHTTTHDLLAGYARWFTTDKVKHIENWLKYLN